MILIREDDERDGQEEIDRARRADQREAERSLIATGLSPDDAFECVRLFGTSNYLHQTD